ncbi:hypothetical protein GEMRC1_007138 [Eukaryota sp. GEM-RC1]
MFGIRKLNIWITSIRPTNSSPEAEETEGTVKALTEEGGGFFYLDDEGFFLIAPEGGSEDLSRSFSEEEAKGENAFLSSKNPCMVDTWLG